LKRKYLLLIILIPLILTMHVGFAVQADPPHHIHLTWQRDDLALAMTVTWQSLEEGSGSTVLYDAEPQGGDPDLYAYSAEGVVHTYSGASGFIHDVELVGLEPETTYYLICGGDGGWSGEMAFKTAPLGRRDFRFVVGGDSRSNPDDRNAVSSAMREVSPSFVLFSGDLVNDGSIQEQWDVFLDHMDDYWTGEDGLTIPIVPALGNHDKNTVNYFDQFALPGNEEWFSINYGPDLHIVVLNSETTLEGLEAQTEWLREDLEEHADYPWKVVLLHRNILPSYHDWWLTGINRWVPIWDTHGVDLVVTGHSHNYMRSNPVNLTASMEEAQPSFSQGVMYLSSGGWGAPLYETREGWWVAYTDSLLHFTQIDLYGNGTLHVQAKGLNGVTFDEARIHKEIPDIGELMAGRLASAELEVESVLGEKALLEETLEVLGGENDALEGELETVTSELEMLEDEIADMEAELEDYREEASEVVSAKEAMEEALEEIGSQLEGLADETGDLRAQLRERTTQMYGVLGVAAVAVIAVIVMLFRNRSG
jgi:prefoldin subunit 5